MTSNTRRESFPWLAAKTIDSALTSFFMSGRSAGIGQTYTVLGDVVEGMDVVEKIATVPQVNGKPTERVDIVSIKVERKP